MTVNVAATFKKDERINNGLEAIVRQLVKEPLERHVVVGVIEVTRITRDIADGGVETPTVRLVSVEALEGDMADAARQLLEKRHSERTGHHLQGALFGDQDEREGEGEGQGEGGEPEKPDDRDPAAGPWPGDPDYEPPFITGEQQDEQQ